MAQPPNTVVRRLQQLLATQGLHRNTDTGPSIGGFFKQQVLKANAQFFHHPVLWQLRLVAITPILALSRFTGLGGQRGHEQKHSKDEGKFHGTPQ
ncbi:hypothetical protein D3C72_1871360 [compost metagenome]